MQSNAQLTITGPPALTSTLTDPRATSRRSLVANPAVNEGQWPVLRSEGWENLAWLLIALAAGAVLALSLSLQA